MVVFRSFPGSAWERTVWQAPPALKKSEPTALAAGLDESKNSHLWPDAFAPYTYIQAERRSLGDSAFPGGAWERVWSALALLLVTCSPGFAAEANMHLRLKDGSFASGKLVCSTEPDRLGWKCDGFENPFDFDIDAVRAVTRVVSPDEEQAAQSDEQTLLFELPGGNQVAGTLLAMDEQWLTVETRLLGTIKVSRAEVQAIVGVNSPSQLLYAGIANDDRWHSTGAVEDWQMEAGAIATNKPNVTICGLVDLPAKSQISLALSWTGTPEFVLSLGVGVTGKGAKVADSTVTTKLEIWDKQLVLVREVDGNADIAMLTDLNDANPKVDLTIFFDQDKGLIAVAEPHGKPLETLTLTPKRPIIGSSVLLTNLGSSITLERFEVRRWDGVVPNAILSDNPIVLDAAGNSTAGEIAGYDRETSELWIKSANGNETRLPIDQLRRGTVEALASSTQTKPPIDRNLLVDVQLMDHTQLSGQWKSATDGKLCFAAIELSDAIQFAPDTVREILGTTHRFRIEAGDQTVGTLKLGECQLAGSLLANSPAGSRTGLHWQPHGSSQASQVDNHASGSITYAKPITPLAATRLGSDKKRRQPNANGGLLAPLLQIMGGNNQGESAEQAQIEKINTNVTGDATGALELRFRSGDAIRGKVVQIDESGMRFSSTQTKTEFATHEQIDHVWLNRLRASSTIDPEKRERLLTVPRAMKKDPPSHLFVSVTGDYLRGRLVKLDEAMMTIEIRSEMMELPVSQVAQIVWLHDRDWNEPKQATSGDRPAVEPSADERPFQIHSITNDQHELTLRPTRTVEGLLEGHSDLLGETQVPIKDLQQLLFGPDIERQLVALRSDPWTLSLATYPRVYREDGGDVATSQSESYPLVGKPAPEFALQSLDGKTFRLSGQRDRVVVLDFWASWCGPCMQTMPLVDEAVAEFGADKVHLAAVNIQETDSKARIATERLGLVCDVLLDQDGQTAAAYNAVAIPQTVIIDRQGNVTHVFVGGGSKFVDEFRAALDSVLTSKP